MKIYFTDSGTGLTKTQAAKLGLVLIEHNILYHGEQIEDKEGIILNEEYIQVAAPNAMQYKAVFDQYAGNELVYISWSQKTKITQTFEQIRQLDLENFTMIDSGFFGEAQLEVVKRIIENKPYNDIKHFFIVRNPKTGWIPVVKDKYCFFTMEDGRFKLLETYDTRFSAIARLKKHVNTKLYYRNDFNSAMGVHCGKDYVGGMHLTIPK